VLDVQLLADRFFQKRGDCAREGQAVLAGDRLQLGAYARPCRPSLPAVRLCVRASARTYLALHREAGVRRLGEALP
jgi:hypothetical protein